MAISGGTYQATDYLYNPAGQLATINDAATGEQWAMTYNLLGQERPCAVDDGFRGSAS